MSGVAGLGQRVMAGRQGPGAAATAGSFDALGMSVTPENVLIVHGVIREEVARLRAAVDVFKRDHGLGMPRLGDDPVSPYASQGFNEATTHLLGNCEADIADLRRLADGLADAARDYGKTEDEIKASFTHGPAAELPGLLAGANVPGPPPMHAAVDLYRTGVQ
ncbi:MAG: hypothetical protein ACR2G2_18125 [Pseudonocardia sp.]